MRHGLCSKMLNFFYFQLVGRWSNCKNAVVMASPEKAKSTASKMWKKGHQCLCKYKRIVPFWELTVCSSDCIVYAYIKE